MQYFNISVKGSFVCTFNITILYVQANTAFKSKGNQLNHWAGIKLYGCKRGLIIGLKVELNFKLCGMTRKYMYRGASASSKGNIQRKCIAPTLKYIFILDKTGDRGAGGQYQTDGTGRQGRQITQILVFWFGCLPNEHCSGPWQLVMHKLHLIFFIPQNVVFV